VESVAYLDSSILLRALLEETQMIVGLETELKYAVSSSIFKVECLRTLDRLQKNSDKKFAEAFSERRARLYSFFKKIDFIPVSQDVLDEASKPLSVQVKTLDAIHIASASLWQRSERTSLIFLTHDKGLARAAQSTGLKVLGC
jgi:predicted nucleic acid-binding protein